MNFKPFQVPDDGATLVMVLRESRQSIPLPAGKVLEPSMTGTLPWFGRFLIRKEWYASLAIYVLSSEGQVSHIPKVASLQAWEELAVEPPTKLLPHILRLDGRTMKSNSKKDASTPMDLGEFYRELDDTSVISTAFKHRLIEAVHSGVEATYEAAKEEGRQEVIDEVSGKILGQEVPLGAVAQVILKDHQNTMAPTYTISTHFYSSIEEAREYLESSGPEFTVVGAFLPSLVTFPDAVDALRKATTRARSV